MASEDNIVVESVPEYTSEEIRVILVGNIGTGKSRLGSNLLGKNGFFPSSTRAEPETVTCTFGQRALDPQTAMVVVDTPGVTDTRAPERLLDIVKSINTSAPGPYVFAFVVRIGKLTGEQIDPLKIFVETFGDKVYQHLIFIFTHKDDLDDEGILEEDYINSTPAIFREMLHKAGDRYAFINNRAKGNELKSQVSAILQLVDELICTNNGEYYTNEMYQVAEEKLAIKRKEIEDSVKNGGHVSSMKRKSLLKEIGLFLTIAIATGTVAGTMLPTIPGVVVGTAVAIVNVVVSRIRKL